MHKQTLKCTDARHLVHLSVGDDTQPEEEKQLTEHLHSCSECRAYHAGMADAMHVLEQVRNSDSVDVPAGAVWSAIAGRVKSRPQKATAGPERRRFNGAVAALCACSLTLALATVIQNLPTSEQDSSVLFGPPVATQVNYGTNPATSNSPITEQSKLLPVRLKNGDVVWVDPVTKLAYVPNLLTTLPGEPDTTF